MNKILGPINMNIRQIDISQCKNFLVKFLGDIEKGLYIDEVQRQRAYEVYDHYINDLNQNSYIHIRWEKLMEGDNNEK